MSSRPTPRTTDGQEPSGNHALRVEEARARILASLPDAPAAHLCAIREALGSVLAEAVLAPLDVPAHTNSAMDGYAFDAATLDAAGGARLRLAGQALAGKPFAAAVPPGGCVQVMTGAVMPAGTDTVAMQEDCHVEGGWIAIGAGQQRGRNVRQAGEDIARGSQVLSPGMRLQAAHIGVLASLGLSEVRVHRPLRVAILATGDELQSIGRPLAEGQIYDSNRYTVHAMLRRLGIIPVDLGVIEDRPQALRAAFAMAAREADAIISTGGVSVGAADYVRPLLAELGQVQFWKIAMKPGRPFAFGRLGAALFFGLPGNPVAAMVTFYQFVRPALLRLGGETLPDPPILLEVPCQDRLNKQPGRTEYLRARLEADAEGRLSVRRLGAQGSGILTSMALGNCFVVLGHEAGSVAPGERVTVQPFSGLV